MTKEYKVRSFEDFMQDAHARIYHGLDDDMPEAFNSWLTDLQVDDLVDYADLYRNEQRLVGKDEIINTLKPSIEKLTQRN